MVKVTICALLDLSFATANLSVIDQAARELKHNECVTKRAVILAALVLGFVIRRTTLDT